MRHRRTVRRRMGFAAAVLATAALVQPVAHAGTGVDHLFLDGKYCDQRPQYKGRPVIADGPASQVALHAGVFEPAYARACRSGSGMVTFLGSGERAGIDATIDRTPNRHFGTANIPMSTTEYIQATLDQRGPNKRTRTSVLHQIPLWVDVLAVGYNVTSCRVSQLNFSSQTLSLVYSGAITRWNHDLIQRDNPSMASLKNCNYPIKIIKRADFSGSTFVFKDYLSKRNPQWAYYKQPAQNQVWPTVSNACPALDEDGMAECILTTQNSIGYLNYHTAKQARIKTARVDNISGVTEMDAGRRFVSPSPAACTAAAASAFIPPAVKPVQAGIYETPQHSPTAGDWSTISLTDAPVGYPICTFGYVFLYQNMQFAYLGSSYPPAQARTTVDYLWTVLTDRAQSRLPAFDYGRLPPSVVEVSRAGMEMIRYQG